MMTANTAFRQRQNLHRAKATHAALLVAKTTMPPAILSVSGVNSALDDWDDGIKALITKAEHAICIMENANA